MPTDDVLLAALKRELAGYVADRKEDRAEQVQEQIARLQGDSAKAEPETTSVEAPEKAVRPQPRPKKGTK